MRDALAAYAHELPAREALTTDATLPVLGNQGSGETAASVCTA